jgi:cytidylate kinase
MEVLVSRPYRDFEAAPATRAEELHEQQFIDTTAEVIGEIAAAGDAVILSRGGGAILRGTTGVLRVGLLGESEDRARRIHQREQLASLEAARELIEHSDSAQARYFEKAFQSNPIDPFLYHFMLNTSEISLEYAAGVIIYAARQMDEQGLLAAEHEALESEEPLTVSGSSD